MRHRLYNFLELRPELVRAGHVFRSSSDSETNIHAYEEYGDEFLRTSAECSAWLLGTLAENAGSPLDSRMSGFRHLLKMAVRDMAPAAVVNRNVLGFNPPMGNVATERLGPAAGSSPCRRSECVAGFLRPGVRTQDGVRSSFRTARLLASSAGTGRIPAVDVLYQSGSV